MRTIILTIALAAAACTEPSKTSDDATMHLTATGTAAAETAVTSEATSSPATDSSPPIAPPVVEEGPALVYQGLKFTPIKPAKARTIEVNADGKILVDGELVGSFVKNEIRDEDGTPTMRVAEDGSVEALGPGASDKKARFGESDVLTIPDGKVRLEKDGSITFTKRDGKSEKAPVKVAGVNDQNRRAAVLLVTYMMMMSRE